MNAEEAYQATVKVERKQLDDYIQSSINNKNLSLRWNGHIYKENKEDLEEKKYIVVYRMVPSKYYHNHYDKYTDIYWDPNHKEPEPQKPRKLPEPQTVSIGTKVTFWQSIKNYFNLGHTNETNEKDNKDT